MFENGDRGGLKTPERLIEKIYRMFRYVYRGRKEDGILAITDDTVRRRIVFVAYTIVLGLAALFMTVVNIITREYVPMCATIVLLLICAAGYVVYRTEKMDIDKLCYTFESITMLVLIFFLVDGRPEGFSSLWICLVPILTMMLTGLKAGSIYGVTGLVVLVFLFWTEAGRSLLQYAYTGTFMVRFPLFYTAVLIFSFLLESIRLITQDQLLSQKEQYAYLFRHDALTDLYNRYGIREKLKSLDLASGSFRKAALMLDVDDFKVVNDTYGHEAGDLVLRSVADAMRQTLCHDCVYARWGGEEFLVIMACRHDPVDTAEMIRGHIRRTPIVYQGREIRITVSIGVALTQPGTVVTEDRLISRADKGLYAAKAAGKNRVVALSVEDAE